MVCVFVGVGVDIICRDNLIFNMLIIMVSYPEF